MDNGNNNTCSIASLACGIVSFFVLPFIFGVASIILGIIGLSRQEEKKNFSIIRYYTWNNRSSLGILFYWCFVKYYNQKKG